MLCELRLEVLGVFDLRCDCILALEDVVAHLVQEGVCFEQA